jgi:hypothetical protein
MAIKIHRHLLKLPLVVEAKAAFHGEATGILDLKMVYLTLVAAVELVDTMKHLVEMAVLEL